MPKEPVEFVIKDGNKVYVQLRLHPDFAEELREAGAKEGRKLPSEIVHRLQEGPPAGAADALLYGWVDPARNKVLGEALGMLAARLEVAGPMTDDRVRDRAGVLAMLKIAVADVLDYLGADAGTLSDDEKNFAPLEARRFTNEFRRPQAGPHSVGARPDLEILSRVAHGEPHSGLHVKGRK